MKEYKTYSVIPDSGQILLSDIPFGAGDRVEIVVTKSENGTRSDRVRKLETLFKETQSLPQIRSLTDDEILREVEAHQSSR